VLAAGDDGPFLAVRVEHPGPRDDRRPVDGPPGR
jgi:hypothetical protein